MARSGTSRRLVGDGDVGGRSARTRSLLVDAAIETLKEEGFAGASARAIAARAGCNQALIFYHFGSVANLLLAALDAVSVARRERYAEAVEGATSPAELVDVAAAIFAEDLEAGHATVLVEMIAGAASTPGLGAEVGARIGAWRGFAEQAIDSAAAGTPLAALFPAGEFAHGVVALYLGLELLSHLEGDRAAALRLFERAKRLALLVERLGPPATSPTALGETR